MGEIRAEVSEGLERRGEGGRERGAQWSVSWTGTTSRETLPCRKEGEGGGRGRERKVEKGKQGRRRPFK